jgi:hypothetical protein
VPGANSARIHQALTENGILTRAVFITVARAVPLARSRAVIDSIGTERVGMNDDTGTRRPGLEAGTDAPDNLAEAADQKLARAIHGPQAQDQPGVAQATRDQYDQCVSRASSGPVQLRR